MGAFFSQPSRRYRNFQIVFSLLTLNFVIPAVTYVVYPEWIAGQLSSAGRMLGGGDWRAPESASHLWRLLGAADVMTLGLMCLLLQLDLRRFYAVLVPLTFMKGYTAALMLGDYLFDSGYPGFLAVALFDGLTACAFVYFARGAHADIRDRADAELVPRPRWGRA